jgi:hypothetical protein
MEFFQKPHRGRMVRVRMAKGGFCSSLPIDVEKERGQ